MNLCALMQCRNEDWVLGLSARVALMWCDSIVIYLHACIDRSKEIAFQLQGEYGIERVHIAADDTPTWDEMGQRQRALEIARDRGATHIAIVDADEILTGNLLRNCVFLNPMKADVIFDSATLNPANCIIQLPGYNLRSGIHRYHSNGIWANRWFSTAFRDDPRLAWCGDKFHDREPHGIELKSYRPISQGSGGIMHLWGANDRRLLAKTRWYKMVERLRWPNKPAHEIDEMYNWAIKGSTTRTGVGTPNMWTYAAVPDEWWAPYKHLMKYLDLNARPWQEDECKLMLAEHGAAKFAGLDLFRSQELTYR